MFTNPLLALPCLSLGRKRSKGVPPESAAASPRTPSNVVPVPPGFSIADELCMFSGKVEGAGRVVVVVVGVCTIREGPTTVLLGVWWFLWGVIVCTVQMQFVSKGISSRVTLCCGCHFGESVAAHESDLRSPLPSIRPGRCNTAIVVANVFWIRRCCCDEFGFAFVTFRLEDVFESAP